MINDYESRPIQALHLFPRASFLNASRVNWNAPTQQRMKAQNTNWSEHTFVKFCHKTLYSAFCKCNKNQTQIQIKAHLYSQNFIKELYSTWCDLKCNDTTKIESLKHKLRQIIIFIRFYDKKLSLPFLNWNASTQQRIKHKYKLWSIYNI